MPMPSQIEVEPGLLKAPDDCSHEELYTYQRRLMGNIVMGYREGDAGAAVDALESARAVGDYIHARFGPEAADDDTAV
jgi:hypothetical protein